MKFRKNTKLGMCTIEDCNDPNFRKVTFDKKTKVSKTGLLSLKVWVMSLEKLASIS